jgi:nitrite reductase/ring-hydroxylating ferredoxin subunit
LQAVKHVEPLCRSDAIPDGGAIALENVMEIGDSVLLLRQGKRVFAYQNICPHAGKRLDWSPGKFLFDNGLLVCTAHGACFKVADGLCVSGPCRGESLSAVAVEIDNGEVRFAQA